MTLNAEALDIIAYLKTVPGKFVTLAEISRRASGRKRFEESPGWARHLMMPLRDAGYIEINTHGHYRIAGGTQPAAQPAAKPAAPATRKPKASIVGDDYFPQTEQPRIVGGDYFPSEA